jgi:hypothetical protein
LCAEEEAHMTFRFGGLAVGLAVWCTACSDKADDSVAGTADDSSTPRDDSATPKDDSGTPNDDSGPGKSDATLVINEVLALNNKTNVDEAGQHEDWIELYNTGTAEIDLEGFQLTDSPDGKTAPWAIPSGNTIAAGGWFLLWCDDDAGDGPLHTDFKLEGNGETIALYDKTGALADELTYDEQAADTSWARHPDGGETWQAGTPTPLAANP